MREVWLKFVVLLIALLVHTACKHQDQTELVGQDIRLAPAGNTFSSTGEYVMDSGDLIEIYVHNHPEYNGRYRVDGAGFITLHKVGLVRAKGRSAQLLRTALTIKLRPFIKHPRVAASIVETGSYKVVFSGSVRRPGVHKLDGRTTLLEGIAIAGGVQSTSVSAKIIVIRADEKGIKRRYITDYQVLMQGSPVLDNFVLERGDMVYINE
ncbi:MAG: polysaccharide biosynthesis/export family protein [Oligoflexus sp.]